MCLNKYYTVYKLSKHLFQWTVSAKQTNNRNPSISSAVTKSISTKTKVLKLFQDSILCTMYKCSQMSLRQQLDVDTNDSMSTIKDQNDNFPFQPQWNNINITETHNNLYNDPG